MPEPITVAYLDHTAKLSGGEIALLRLLESLDRESVRPLVVLAEDGPLVAKLRGVEIETLIEPLSGELREVRKDTLGVGAMGKLGAAAGYFRYALRLARLLRARGVRVIHTNSLKSDFYGALAGSLARIPVVWHVRDHIDPTYLPGPAVTHFRALAGRWPTFVVAISRSVLEKLFPNGPRAASRVVHDGLAARELLSPPPTRPFGTPPRVVIVGRLTEWKGQHIFLEAAQKVLASGVDATFELAGTALFGETDYEVRLRRQVENAGIGARVEFLGFVSDVPNLLRHTDILVHASTTPEPFGQVVIEGMAEGVPVIATGAGGVKEIIVDGESGLLVPPGDADEMARALLALLSNPARAESIGRAGHARVRTHFSAARTARSVEQIYRELLTKKRYPRRDSNSQHYGSEP